jgi:hypothetical protein
VEERVTEVALHLALRNLGDIAHSLLKRAVAPAEERAPTVERRAGTTPSLGALVGRIPRHR